MSEILLRPGEALRIENDGGRVIIEVRLAARRGLGEWWRRWVQRLVQERDARELAHFDEHLLNDIGLGPGAGNPLAERIHAYRQQESQRLAMARVGLI